MVLTYDAYNETLQNQKEKESEVQVLKEKYEQDMKTMREEMENKFQEILAKIDAREVGDSITCYVFISNNLIYKIHKVLNSQIAII